MSEIQIEGSSFLVSGGANLIGSHLTEALLSGGARRVVVFDNLTFGIAPVFEHVLADERVELIRGDILRLDQLINAMQDVDGVFAMAALLTAPLAKDPRKGLDVNITGLQNQLDAARHSGVKKVVLASSIAVYGNDVDGIVDETRGWAGADISAPFAIYGLTKRVGEQLGRFYSSTYGLGFTATRFSTVYGERQHDRGVNTLVIPRTLESVAAGRAPELVGGGLDSHDFIHVADVAAGTVRAMEAGVDGEAYMIASGVSTTTRRIVELVLKASGSDLQPVDIEDSRVDRPTTSAELLLDVSKAKRELGWTATISVEEGIARLVAWLLEHESDRDGS